MCISTDPPTGPRYYGSLSHALFSAVIMQQAPRHARPSYLPGPSEKILSGHGQKSCKPNHVHAYSRLLTTCLRTIRSWLERIERYVRASGLQSSIGNGRCYPPKQHFGQRT